MPISLARFLRDKGFDVIHTSELPSGNETTDSEINRISLSEQRIVISKDGDFYHTFTATKEPYKLLHVRTGNITNFKLVEIFEKNLAAILDEFEESDIVEIDHRYMIALH